MKIAGDAGGSNVAAVAHDRYLRRQAIEMAAQLPEDYEDAVRILALTREILDHFLEGHSEGAEYGHAFIISRGSTANTD